MDSQLLEIKDLFVEYVTDDYIVQANNGINLSIREGESWGLAGETGAGKTTAALSIMQLLPQPAGIITQGDIVYRGKSLITAKEKIKREIRGRGISMIFQDPMTALNPTMTIGKQMLEAVIEHGKLKKQKAKEICINLLETVGIQSNRFNDYPHQLSGGMRQRVVIAMALLCNPDLLIADEPTTALDVTIQAQVLDIIRGLMKERNMAMLLITHDLGVVAETCEFIAIMYAGEIVESGTVQEVFYNTLHPYTIGLFESIPRLDDENEFLTPIKGSIPNPADLPRGCPFYLRCRFAQEICKNESPDYYNEGHLCKCHFKRAGGN